MVFLYFALMTKYTKINFVIATLLIETRTRVKVAVFHENSIGLWKTLTLARGRGGKSEDNKRVCDEKGQKAFAPGYIPKNFRLYLSLSPPMALWQ